MSQLWPDPVLGGLAAWGFRGCLPLPRLGTSAAGRSCGLPLPLATAGGLPEGSAMGRLGDGGPVGDLWLGADVPGLDFCMPLGGETLKLDGILPRINSGLAAGNGDLCLGSVDPFEIRKQNSTAAIGC